jgi:hypothetical protein
MFQNLYSSLFQIHGFVNFAQSKILSLSYCFFSQWYSTSLSTFTKNSYLQKYEILFSIFWKNKVHVAQVPKCNTHRPYAFMKFWLSVLHKADAHLGDAWADGCRPRCRPFHCDSPSCVNKIGLKRDFRFCPTSGSLHWQEKCSPLSYTFFCVFQCQINRHRSSRHTHKGLLVYTKSLENADFCKGLLVFSIFLTYVAWFLFLFLQIP